MSEKYQMSCVLNASYAGYELEGSYRRPSDMQCMISCGWLNGISWMKIIGDKALSQREAMDYIFEQSQHSKKADIYGQKDGLDFYIFFEETQYKGVRMTLILLKDDASASDFVSAARSFLGLCERFTIIELRGCKEG